VACDLVESTALAQQLGDRSIADVMHLLDRHARDLVERHGGQEIDKTDGFLLMFDRPVQAIGFALDYQRLLHELTLSEFLPLKARIGIHVGDVVLWRNNPSDIARGAKPLEVEGLVKPVAARLMGLALPGQILLSGVARALALRAQDELEIEFPPEWRMHGRYMFKGVAEPVPVFEVGETGIAPLRQPAYSSKAYRETPWWRRPGLLALEAAVLLSAVVVPTWIFLRSPPVIAFAERDWVVVGSLKNLTEEHRFDDALDTAFRLGLEQSRYVNVLAGLKVRETVALMQRDPDKADIDRATGSEVALRDGARALILPTVAEVGRNVRVTAEVIDPGSQTTVYTESAEGVGVESVLQSVDQINQRLRERLGEALASVAKDSQPLDRVATSSLDALRAFSLAQRAYDRRDLKESIGLYRQAIKLDPGFAIARVHLARSYVVVDRESDAIAELDQALAARDRASPRDALYMEAWRASLSGPHRVALEKWKMLAQMYPDFYRGASLYAYYARKFGNLFDQDTLTAAEQAASPRNPNPIANDESLGLLYLGREQYDLATKKLQSVALASPVNNYLCALPYAALRQFERADTELARGQQPTDESEALYSYMARFALLYDNGKREEAWRVIATAQQLAAKHDAHYALLFLGAELSVRALTQSASELNAPLGDYAARLQAALRDAVAERRVEIEFQLLLAAYTRASLGEADRAAELVAGIGPEAAGDDYPMLSRMLTVAQAQLLRAQHKPQAALELLQAHEDGSELYVAHAVLLGAHDDLNDKTAAEHELRWLTQHRGRAYAEYNMREILMPLNAALSDRAGERLAGASR
jgi:putative peptide modification system cyclase